MQNRIHHFFIPSEHNNFRARLLHLDVLTFFVVSLFVTTFFYRSLAMTSLGQVLGIATDITSSALLSGTNQKRAENGAGALNYNDQLASAACAKANYMIANNLWAHYGPDGTTPWSFVLASGYKYTFAGENLAKDFMFSGDVVEAWMNSPTHRENMLRKDYKDVGFCTANGTINGQETTLVVQMFGSPQSGARALVPQAEAQTNNLSQRSPTTAVQAKIVPSTAQLSPSPTLPSSTIVAAAGRDDTSSIMPRFLASLRFDMTLFWSMLFGSALFLDFYFAKKLRLTRVVGNHGAHLIFVGFAIIGLFIITKGAIL